MKLFEILVSKSMAIDPLSAIRHALESIQYTAPVVGDVVIVCVTNDEIYRVSILRSDAVTDSAPAAPLVTEQG